MPFFAEPPRRDDDPRSVERYYDHPESLPAHWLPGRSDVQGVLVRTADTVVALRVVGSYPRGIELEVRAWMAPPDEPPAHEPGGRWVGDDLRLGLLWPDGRRAETLLHRWGGAQAAEPDADFRLDPSGGSGGGLSYDARYWLHPLPPPGPVQVFLRWDARGVAETSTTLDLSPAVVAAADAEELWHLPAFSEEHPEGGWFAYAPMGNGTAYGSRLTMTPDEPSGDGLDGQDEHG